ncbi:ABC transporter permease [Chengkuizengella axinellae]|uniref:ABC transporter permease n=1 Tax=Chengkuizengella axinellae TaxID=3064388 RepID=A0ABT9J1R1_9BACL|nr:ABC transporter permease [Chengkuizengella sp. 2205SS18-9]MDP5275543.1 ABC transporter permease [Chengkuizengella sp. 2205SS18-9]
MGKYLLHRFIFMLVTIWVVITLTFFLMKLMPGSPFNEDKLPESVREVMLEKYGLDKSIPEQYFQYLTNAIQGDFGTSYITKGREVTTIIFERIGPSATLGLQAAAISIPFGVLLGMAAALRRGKMLDYMSVGFAVIGFAIPNFVVAVLLQYIFGGNHALFGLLDKPPLPVALWGEFKHTILPTLSLAFGGFAYYTRMMRSEMLEVLGQDYIKTAKSKGLSKRVVLFRHCLRNALIPIATSLPVFILFALTGSLVIETIFGIPGIGNELVDSVRDRDYSVTMGLTLFYSMLYIVALFLVDILYSLIDPRIRVLGGSD